MIKMLELIIPLMDHPAENFLRTVDMNLCNIIKKGGMILVASAVTCISAIHARFEKFKSVISEIFLNYLRKLLFFIFI